MGLAPLVQHRCPRICSHNAPAQFVVGARRPLGLADQTYTRSGEYLFCQLNRMIEYLPVVLARREMATCQRKSVLVFAIRTEVDI